MSLVIENTTRRIESFTVRLVIPQKYWFGRAIYIGLILVFLQALHFSVFYIMGLVDSDSPAAARERTRSFSDMIVSGVLISPMIESALIAVLYRLMQKWASFYIFAVTNVVITIGMHTLLSRPIDAISLSVAFYIMSGQYYFMKKKGLGATAYWSVTLTHSTYNALLILIIVMIDPTFLR